MENKETAIHSIQSAERARSAKEAVREKRIERSNKETAIRVVQAVARIRAAKDRAAQRKRRLDAALSLQCLARRSIAHNYLEKLRKEKTFPEQAAATSVLQAFLRQRKAIDEVETRRKHEAVGPIQHLGRKVTAKAAVEERRQRRERSASPVEATAKEKDNGKQAKPKSKSHSPKRQKPKEDLVAYSPKKKEKKQQFASSPPSPTLRRQERAVSQESTKKKKERRSRREAEKEREVLFKQRIAEIEAQREAQKRLAKAAIDKRQQKDAAKIENTLDRIDAAQFHSIGRWEERIRDEIIADELAGFLRIERSAKAHHQFVLVDTERIRRAEAPRVTEEPDIGLTLLYEQLKKRDNDDETKDIHKDRRRRVADLLAQKRYSEQLQEELKLREQYTKDIQKEAIRIKKERAEELRRTLTERKQEFDKHVEESVNKTWSETEEGRQRRLERVQYDLEFVHSQGNTQAKLREAEEKRARSKALREESDYVRRGFVKKRQYPTRAATASPGSSTRTHELSETDTPESRDAIAEKRREFEMKQFEEAEHKRQQLIEKKKEEILQRRQEENEALELAKAQRAAARERREKEAEERKRLLRELGSDKAALRRQIAEAGEQRRLLEQRETELINQQIHERIEYTKSRPHPLEADIRSTLQDAETVKATHEKAKTMERKMEKDKQREARDRFLARHTAEESRQKELEMMRDDKVADSSRKWHERYSAKTERQEVAKLQQLMTVRNKAMAAKADSLMAKEIVERGKARVLLQNQIKVSHCRQEMMSTDDSSKLHRKLLEKMYSAPPELQQSPARSEDGKSTELTPTPDVSAIEQESQEPEAEKESQQVTIVSDAQVEVPPKKAGTAGSKRRAGTPSLISTQPLRRAFTPQPTRVLPLDDSLQKPTLSNPSRSLLRRSDVPEKLKEKAWHLLHLIEEVEGPARHTSSAFGSRQPTEKAIDTQPDRKGPRTVSQASDRLTKRSIAQDAMKLVREQEVAVPETIHDHLPKVTTPNRRLYVPPEVRREEEESLIAKQREIELSKALSSAGQPSAKEVDEYFTQRFYDSQLSRRQVVRTLTQEKVMQRSVVHQQDTKIDEEELRQLVSRLTKVRRAQDVEKLNKTSKEIASSPERSRTPANQGTSSAAGSPGKPNPTVERLYTVACEKQQKENMKLDSLYMKPLEDSLKRKTKKLSPSKLETSTERLYKGRREW